MCFYKAAEQAPAAVAGSCREEWSVWVLAAGLRRLGIGVDGTGRVRLLRVFVEDYRILCTYCVHFSPFIYVPVYVFIYIYIHHV